MTTTAPTPVKVERMSFGRWMKTVGWRHAILAAAVIFALFPISYIINLATSQGKTLTSACPLDLQGLQTIQCILPLPPTTRRTSTRSWSAISDPSPCGSRTP